MAMKGLLAVLVVAISLALTGCVPSDVYEDVTSKNQELTAETQELESQVKDLQSQLEEAQSSPSLDPSSAYLKRELNGVTFYHPADWTVEDGTDGSTVSLTGYLSTAVLNVISVSNGDGAMNLDSQVNQDALFVGYGQNMPDYRNGATTTFSAFGYPAAKHTFETTSNGEEIDGTVFAVVTPTQMISLQIFVPASASGFGIEGEYEAVWDSMSVDQ